MSRLRFASMAEVVFELLHQISQKTSETDSMVGKLKRK